MIILLRMCLSLYFLFFIKETLLTCARGFHFFKETLVRHQIALSLILNYRVLIITKIKEEKGEGWFKEEREL